MPAKWSARAPYSEFDGGKDIDTLQLVFTRAEWQRSDVQADLAKALAFIAEIIGRNGEAGNRDFRFSAFNLQFKAIEKIVVVVDGVTLDPRNEGVTLSCRHRPATEDIPSLAINLLTNDAVPDLVRAVSLSQPKSGTVALTQDNSNPAKPVANAVYAPNATAFQHLAAGEKASDSFTAR